MVDVWTWWLIVGTAGCGLVSFLLAVVFRRRVREASEPDSGDGLRDWRGPRAIRAAGLGVLLVPVTALFLWGFGVTASTRSVSSVQGVRVLLRTSATGSASTGAVLPVTLTPSSGTSETFNFVLAKLPATIVQGHAVAVLETETRPVFAAEIFWLGLCVLAIAALFAAFASRPAKYLAAVGLIAFGVYQLVALAVFDPSVNGTGSWDWLFGETSARAVGMTAVLSVAAGLVLTRYTIIADLLLRDELSSRVRLLTQTRADAMDEAAAELRRLERDLHDGAQARLVAIGLSLRALEKMIPANPDAAVALAAECRQSSAQALASLRDLVRGIYPPVLAERGLGDAVRALALDSPVPVACEIDLPGRPPAPLESAVYFAVAEALNNVAKHATAATADVRLYHARGLLRAEVTDDGIGGADPARGTGLAGIERRLGAFDGILAVSSPAGGPTIVIIEVPCALSSPKISTC